MHVPTVHVLDTSKHPGDPQPDHHTTCSSTFLTKVCLYVAAQFFMAFDWQNIVVLGLLFK